ncbi:putative SecDF protein-export membrane protein [Streptomyces scabiei 87.22]|uniref:Multifunctional fusion protein n=1 Tax=Streptomyces scabiei (strain 87.22) TaxID=680198 RepID=C9YVQ1_STRSW|nr:protein translocase subunit SecD [Streptomyces scabiei]MDX3081078.1 protein translocase subunit SecD [Streptomyces scabiei]MDX3173168.1 protein translocase subunit SecD [Streptomyces scabiei]MDX3269079.1 protein translocase subunit SecD [Streptomyces scabiei]MDX3391250.1 protein translocase subunit SecD [Streptomyces scabiei]CBG67799.1 putative SecDF protein-export membrane protein [Streptomyces scabiei 87.22]
MTRAPRVRGLLALAAVALSVFIALTTPVQLGLDLRGGTQIVLETRPTDTTPADSEATDRTLEVLRGRIDALGVAEPTLTRSGDNRIVVELPGVQDPAEAAEVLGRTARLTFHQVLGTTTADATDKNADRAEEKEQAKEEKRKLGDTVLADESGTLLRLEAAALTGQDVKEAAARLDQQNGTGWHVTLDFEGAGGDGWARLTGRAACAPAGDPARRVAIVLDDKIISSPQIDPSVRCETGISGGSTQITGSFGADEAKELALLINGGALPVPVENVEQRTVGPTLGAEAIEASAWAAAVGTTLTALFIIAVYRLMGVLATVALLCYGLISYAALAALGATLTLPGLAGFVLAIGMAVDANVLVFERAREEYAAQRRPSPRSALTAGFRGAFSAITDSNVTTLIAAGLLFFLASGPVRGFGVTLGIGVLASMFSALVITRVLADHAAFRPSVRRRPRLTGIARTGAVRDRLTRTPPQLMRRPRRWLAASAVVLAVAVAGIGVRGLDFGIEFTGGRLVEYTTTPVDPDRARAALADAGFPRAVVQTSGDNGLTVRTERLSEAQAAAVTDTVGTLTDRADKVRDEAIGPSLGKELRNGALIALAVALGAQLLYLAARFRWLFGTSAVAALAHDVVILVGVFAWLGKPVDGVFLAALLTVIGYSVNDSVVVFDRVRDLGRVDRAAPFAAVANRALLQTLPRTVNTGMGAAFILTALAVLGGDSLTDFALALLIGLAVGTYSSMFTATPLAVELHRRR